MNFKKSNINEQFEETAKITQDEVRKQRTGQDNINNVCDSLILDLVAGSGHSRYIINY